MMKQKVSAKINNDRVGPTYSKSDIVFMPNDSPQVKGYKMRMILENNLDIPSRMITEDFCEICNMAFTNIMSSMHHYDSDRHSNNVLSYGKSTAVEMILNTYPDFYLGYFNADWFVNCVRTTLKKCKQKPDQWMCDLCSIPLSGESHAKQHFLGTAHKKRAQEGITFNEKMSRVAAAMRATEAASQLERYDQEIEKNADKEEDEYDEYQNGFNDEEENNYDNSDYQEGNWENDMDYDSYNRAYDDSTDWTGENVIYSGSSDYTQTPQKMGYQATFTTPRINKRGYDAAFR
uniref:U1-type domain-containing protein n=1 Tax=Romanomermis culicivorax TaxID=13658 RepID=A0A915KV62_ROMCU